MKNLISFNSGHVTKKKLSDFRVPAFTLVELTCLGLLLKIQVYFGNSVLEGILNLIIHLFINYFDDWVSKIFDKIIQKNFFILKQLYFHRNKTRINYFFRSLSTTQVSSSLGFKGQSTVLLGIRPWTHCEMKLKPFWNSYFEIS